MIFIQTSFKSSLDSEEVGEDGKNEYEKYEMDLNEKNKIIITPIITSDNYEQTNFINNNIKSDNKNNDSNILDINKDQAN